MRYYKCVRVYHKKLYSWSLGNNTSLGSPWLIEYIERQWVTPNVPNSKVFIFGSLFAAEQFSGADPNVAIYEVEVPSVPKALEYICLPSEDEYFEDFWDFRWKRENNLPGWLDVAPVNSYSCDAVKLVKKEVSAWY